MAQLEPMIHIDPKKSSVQEIFRLLLGGVAPRPIALVSTLSPDGLPNLAPFSFFNAFGGNPPIVAFSPSRRRAGATTKDTYRNLRDTNECVIQAVTYEIIQQVNLASGEYPSEIDEFVKSGLTPIPSELVKPARVMESPFQMECRLQQMITLGDGPGSGNLAICEVIRFHVAENIMRDGVILPDLIDLVGRNSADFYTRARGQAVIEVKKPPPQPVAYDGLPEFVRSSDVLTANNLGQLGNVDSLPTVEESVQFVQDLPGDVEGGDESFFHYHRLHDYLSMIKVAVLMLQADESEASSYLELAAKTALEMNDPETAWRILLYKQWRETQVDPTPSRGH